MKFFPLNEYSMTKAIENVLF